MSGATIVQCVNCGERKPHAAKQLCRACYTYHAKHGTHRTPEMIRRKRPTRCRRCGQGTPVSHGRCEACAWYYRTNGVERPEHLIHRDAPCRHCGAPRAAYPRTGWPQGYCQPCYSYRHRSGKPRPLELVRIQAPYGWCECGTRAVAVRPSTTAREVRRGVFIYEKALCERHLREEERAA